MAEDNQPQVPTYESIQETFKANPELQQKWQAEFLQSENGAKVLNNHLNSNREILKKELTGEGYKNAMTTIETTIGEKLGIEKPEGMKATDWLLSVFEKQTEQSGEGDEVLKQINATLTDENKALKGQLTEAASGFETYKLQSSIEGAFKEAAAALKWKADVDSDLLFGPYGAVATAIEKYKSTAKKMNDGKLVFMEGDKPLLDPATQQPATAKEVIEMRFGKYIAVATAGGGAPGSPDGGAPDATLKGFDPSKYSTKDETGVAFNKHMSSQGISVGSKEYQEAAKALTTSEAWAAKQ